MSNGRQDQVSAESELAGFDSYQLALGDELRGERATLNKSLLDVQRDLKIKASYIDAIENCDLDVFPNYGFIAGYVRSYARYLGLDPEDVYTRFCDESGFEGVNGAIKRSVSEKPKKSKSLKGRGPVSVQDEVLERSKIGRVSTTSSFDWGNSASGLASIVFLLGLVGAVGYGGWFVLQEVQRVTLAPVEQGPEFIISEPAGTVLNEPDFDLADASGPMMVPAADDRMAALERLYAPQAISNPVFESRDGPIVSLDPNAVGVLVEEDHSQLVAEAVIGGEAAADQIVDAIAQADLEAVELPVATTPDLVSIHAAQAAWVRVRLPDDSVLFEKILAAGEAYTLPEGVEGVTLRAGNSGSVFLSVGEAVYGPLGTGPRVAKNVSLDAEQISQAWPLAEISDELQRNLGLIAAADPR